jgi:hypothetical protein
VLATPQLLSHHHLFLAVDAMDLKHVLGDIQTDRGNLHLDGSPQCDSLQRSPYGTSMPGAGAVHHIKINHRASPAISLTKKSSLFEVPPTMSVPLQPHDTRSAIAPSCPGC